jgi:hypothetical protein
MSEERLKAAEDEITRLRSLIDRDRTGLAAAIDRMVKEASGRLWIVEGRGSYEWDDDRYRKEAGDALRAVIEIGKSALNESGQLADSAFRFPVRAYPEADVIDITKPVYRVRWHLPAPDGRRCLTFVNAVRNVDAIEQVQQRERGENFEAEFIPREKVEEWEKARLRMIGKSGLVDYRQLLKALVSEVAERCYAPAWAEGPPERLVEEHERRCERPARWGILTAWTCSKHRRPGDKIEIGSPALRAALAALEG